MTTLQYLTGLLQSGGSGAIPFDAACLMPGDWEQVVSFAERQRLAPQLYTRLEMLNKLRDIPAPVSQRLRAMYLGGIARGVQLSHELAAILNCLNENNIPVIVLKGPHLAEIVYKDWGVRPMDDFDLMVRRDDIGRAVGLLKGLGYEPSLALDTAAAVAAHPHFPVMCKGHRFFVEPHFTLAAPESPFVIDIDGIWSRAVRTTIAGADVLVLSDIDLLLHLCIHAAYNHRYSSGLLPLRDIAETINSRQGLLDWNGLKDRAMQWKADRCLALTLSLVHEYFGTGAGQGEETNSGLDQAIHAIARDRVLRGPAGQIPLTTNVSELLGKGTLRSKAEIVRRRLFPPPSVLATMYPVDPASKRILLYYGVRVKDLLLRYGKTGFALMKQDAIAVEQMKNEEQGTLLSEWLAGGDLNIPDLDGVIKCAV